LQYLKPEDLKEQHVCNKCCFQLEKNATEAFKMLKVAFGKLKLGGTRIYVWFCTFKNSVTSTENDECSGYPVMSKTDEI
jgi:hypothetical protein